MLASLFIIADAAPSIHLTHHLRCDQDGGMRFLPSVALLATMANSALAQTPAPTPLRAPEAPGMPSTPLPASYQPAQSLPNVVPSTVTLDQYVADLRRHASFTLMMNVSPKRDKNPPYSNFARTDPDLAKSPLIRDLSIGILQELERYTATEQSIMADLQEKMKKPPKSTKGFSQQDIARQNRSGRFESPSSPFAEAEKRGRESQARRAAAEKAIAGRIATLEQQKATPAGKNFALSGSSTIYQLISNPGYASILFGQERTFEAASNAAGGIIAFLTRRERVPRKPADASPQALAAAEGEYDEILVAQPESCFVRGYTKPVRAGERIRLKVLPGKPVTINGTTMGEFVVVE